MIEQFSVRSLRFFKGGQAGLPQSTVLVRIGLNGKIDQWPQFRDVLIAACRNIDLAEPLFGVDWEQLPQPLLLKAPRLNVRAQTQTAENSGELGAWIVALCVVHQRLARDAVHTGRVLNSYADGWDLALPYQRPDVFKEALSKTLQMVVLCQPSELKRPEYQHLWTSQQQSRTRWLSRVQIQGLDSLSQRFALAALSHSVPVAETEGVLRLGQGSNSLRLLASFTDRSSTVAANLARSKVATMRLLRNQAIPVPRSESVSTRETAKKVQQTIGFPVVVKPSNQDMGLGVVTGISDIAQLNKAYQAAAELSPRAVIVEEHVRGDDHRILIINGEMLVATRRLPGGVTGDGYHTVRQLLATLNADPRRGNHKRSLLIEIDFDEEAMDCLREADLGLDDVPENGQRVILRRTANIATGGTAEDVTNEIHPDNRYICERAARIIGLDIAGVDFICPDIRRSWREVGGAILEVNAQPGFRPHWLSDPSRDFHGEIIKKLFKARPSRIPTAVITGAHGKTAVARILHQLWNSAGKVAGRCETGGVWVGNTCVLSEQIAAYQGAKLLLEDPDVEAAIFVMPRKQLLISGHPCAHYDVAALLNLAGDSARSDELSSLNTLVNLGSEVLLYAQNAVVINVDDSACLSLALELRRSGRLEDTVKAIYVSCNAGSKATRDHLASGGAAVLIDAVGGKPWLVFADGVSRHNVITMSDVASAIDTHKAVSEINVMCAAAIAWAQDLPVDVIRKKLCDFSVLSKRSPGMNHFAH